jgi:ABC-2 type transport system ATP-binding protein
VLVSSHLLGEVAQTVDSVVVLDRGRLIAHSTLAELGIPVTPEPTAPAGLEDVFMRMTVGAGRAER